MRKNKRTTYRHMQCEIGSIKLTLRQIVAYEKNDSMKMEMISKMIVYLDSAQYWAEQLDKYEKEEI